MKKVLGPAKFLDSSKELYAWMEPLIALSLPKEPVDMNAIKAEGFGPEAHDEPIVNDTKMVVWMCEYIFSMLIVGLVNVAPDVYVVQAFDHDNRLIECAFIVQQEKIT